MTRCLPLLIALSPPAWSQSIATSRVFLHEVDALRTRMAYGQPIDPLIRLQEDIGFSAASAEAVLDAARAYIAEGDRIDGVLRRGILTRRIQIAGEFEVTYSSELDMVNWANFDLQLFLLERMDDLSERLGEEEYQKVVQFLDDRTAEGWYFPLRPGETGLRGSAASAGWTQSPLGFWRNLIKGPLSTPDAESLFEQNYKDAILPPPDIVTFLEGTVVSVTPEDSLGRRVLLAMQEGEADAALLIDGSEWKLRREPTKGEVVRFSGVAREFTREPFLILFAPERITGLSVDSTQPNPPFTTPGMVR